MKVDPGPLVAERPTTNISLFNLAREILYDVIVVCYFSYIKKKKNLIYCRTIQ
jgi:hypothetical protein